MAHFDDIYEIAVERHGIVTAAQAREASVTTGEMARWCDGGKLIRCGHGVYRLAHWVPTPYDPFAEAVALAGEGAYLWGDAVLSMHNLALVDPAVITVATPRCVRRRLPAWIRLMPAPQGAAITVYEEIPSQSVVDALRTCKDSVMPYRLLKAADEARNKGFVTEGEYKALKKELK